jgi:transposase InsO family protein
MSAYAAQRQAKQHHHRKPPQPPITPERAAWLSRVEELRVQRRRQRWVAEASDAAWRELRQAHRQQKAAWGALSVADKRRHSAQHAAEEARWHAARLARRAERVARWETDRAWRQARQTQLAERAQWRPDAQPVSAWLAILVILDNCTRRCLGLPVFVAGVHVTAEVVVTALRESLPQGLQFVISDNGTHFRSDACAALAEGANFVHVRIAPYRARTNGIAERFVRTLKEWLETHSWTLPEEASGLLAQLLTFYNDRPHQGRELDGLSPNEYDRRLRLSAIC